VFNIDIAGNVYQKQINVQRINKNSIQDSDGVFILFLVLFMVVNLFYYMISLFSSMKGKYISYSKWYELFIKNKLSKAQMYFRNQKEPELIRKIKFVFEIS
jgi:hypothetical protein